jgi:urease accessory protein
VEVYEKAHSHCHGAVDDVVVLNHEQRQKGRLKATTAGGHEIRLFLERGRTLFPGEFLKTECGRVIQIDAAEEEVMVATCDDWRTFSRACYHLGNRHVKIQVGERLLKITPDYVLQEMLEQLGLTVKTINDVFVPESGAYNTGAHSKGHHHH